MIRMPILASNRYQISECCLKNLVLYYTYIQPASLILTANGKKAPSVHCMVVRSAGRKISEGGGQRKNKIEK